MNTIQKTQNKPNTEENLMNAALIAHLLRGLAKRSSNNLQVVA